MNRDSRPYLYKIWGACGSSAAPCASPTRRRRLCGSVWRRSRIAFLALELSSKSPRPTVRCHHPLASAPRRIVTNVLIVSALERSDPVVLLVLVKADDSLLHFYSIRPESAFRRTRCQLMPRAYLVVRAGALLSSFDRSCEPRPTMTRERFAEGSQASHSSHRVVSPSLVRFGFPPTHVGVALLRDSAGRVNAGRLLAYGSTAKGPPRRAAPSCEPVCRRLSR